MQDLTRTLLDYDVELLRVIANRWDVDLDTRDQQEAAEKLAQGDVDGERVLGHGSPRSRAKRLVKRYNAYRETR